MQPHGEVPRFRDDWSTRVKAEVYCFYLIFRFHDHNNHLRKAVTIMVVLVWAVLEVLLALDIGTVPDSLGWLRMFVGLLLARMWNIELNSFASGLAPSSRSSQSNETDGDNDR